MARTTPAQKPRGEHKSTRSGGFGAVEIASIAAIFTGSQYVYVCLAYGPANAIAPGGGQLPIFRYFLSSPMT